MPWTDEMVEKLKKFWAQGVTTGEIGKRLGISKNSIVGKVHRLGLEGRPSPIKKSDEGSSAKPKKTTAKTEKKTEKKAEKKETVKTAKPVESNKKTSTPKPKVEQAVKPVKIKEEKKEATKAQKTAKAPEKKVVTPTVAPKKTAEVNLDVQIDEDDIKLIKSLEIKPEKDYQKENISLTDLDNHTCRWPLGDPKDDDFHFCGRKVKTGQTYCDEHSAIAYVKPNRH